MRRSEIARDRRKRFVGLLRSFLFTSIAKQTKKFPTAATTAIKMEKVAIVYLNVGSKRVNPWLERGGTVVLKSDKLFMLVMSNLSTDLLGFCQTVLLVGCCLLAFAKL